MVIKIKLGTIETSSEAPQHFGHYRLAEMSAKKKIRISGNAEINVPRK